MMEGTQSSFLTITGSQKDTAWGSQSNIGLAELRSRFWAARSRHIVKTIIARCVVCRAVSPLAPESAPTADLPEFGVKETVPFGNTGGNFAGP